MAKTRKGTLRVGGYTIRAEVDSFGTLRLNVDVRNNKDSLFQVLNLSDKWVSGKHCEVIFSTDDRLGILEGAFEPVNEEEFTASLRGDDRFRAKCRSIGKGAIRQLGSTVEFTPKEIADQLLADTINPKEG